MIITYPMIVYYWSMPKIFWNFYVIFCTILYFSYLGMLLVSLTPNVMVASVLFSAFYTTFNLFSGFLIPKPVSYYWFQICGLNRIRTWKLLLSIEYIDSFEFRMTEKFIRTCCYINFQQIPKWWMWLYSLTPTSWTLEGLLTSQYGDIDQEIQVFLENKTISAFLEEYFGFHFDHLLYVAVVLTVFPLTFASLFAFCVGRLNFQRRWACLQN